MHELPPDTGEHAIDPPAAADAAPSGDPIDRPAVAVPVMAVDTDADPGAATPEATEAAPAAPAPRPELTPAACAARLAQLFPALFGNGPRKPLKLRIQADIQQRAPGEFTKKTLSAFLHRHTTTTAYLLAMAQATGRFDLDGQAAGDLSDEHRQAAATELARRRGLHEERRAAEHAARRAAQVQAQTQAQAQARQQRAAQDTARQERALLLRAFEATTLTPANFCALKGIAQTELDTQLVLAREERTQWLQSRGPAQAPHNAHTAPGPARGPGPAPHDARRSFGPRGEGRPTPQDRPPRGRGRPGGTGRP